MKSLKFLGLLACMAIQAGCGSPPKAIPYPNENGEKTGPGLLTGEKGAFEVDLDLKEGSLNMQKDATKEKKKN